MDIGLNSDLGSRKIVLYNYVEKIKALISCTIAFVFEHAKLVPHDASHFYWSVCPVVFASMAIFSFDSVHDFETRLLS